MWGWRQTIKQDMIIYCGKNMMCRSWLLVAHKSELVNFQNFSETVVKHIINQTRSITAIHAGEGIYIDCVGLVEILGNEAPCTALHSSAWSI